MVLALGSLAVACGSSPPLANGVAVGVSTAPRAAPDRSATPLSASESPPDGDGAPQKTAAITAPGSASAPTTGATNRPEPPDGRTSVADDFPEGTRSLKVREVAHVFGAPSDRARYIGKIMGGTRVAWRRVVAPDVDDRRSSHRPPRCAAWVEIVPSGWLCKTLLAPSPDPPKGVRQPVVKIGQPTPDDYFKVMVDDTKAFKSEDDVRADVVDKLVSTKVMLVGTGVVHVDDTPYLKTDHGLIEAASLAKFWPSDFEGIVLAEHPAVAFPFAWVFYERGARKAPVYAAPDSSGGPVRVATRREIVSFGEEQNGFVRIADREWIERKYVRVARLTDPPPGTTDSAQWIDVDRDEQVLVAYQGTKPVFVTLVSTGGKKDPTPLATYQVRAKAATTPMDGDPSIPNHYEVSAVPWAVRFAKGFFIHGAYWHDGFGGARSHGCVNVSPKDAAFLFDWIAPAVPDGWSEVEVPLGSGAVVRIRDREHPTPPLFDYSREEPWNVATPPRE
jgi:lipoprotein-anchoring transpeptidase ErfK/SrfK